MTVTIPDEILEAASITETELLREIALILFQQKKISLGKAAHLAQMDQLQFLHLLGSRKIPIHYGIEEFEEDLQTLEKLEWV